MNALQPWHLIILVLVVVLLFGAKRLPDTARSIGKSMKIFKAETKDMRGEHAEAQAADPEKPTPADTKQISSTPVAEDATTSTPSATSTTSKDDQVEQLQRQLDELKKQQGAEQAQKNG
ncbi:Sec-independent protein translocase subunit TatA [Prauserella rugosa]|uniref:Sec-independent protein translocase protein TatA n=1 Tax=Prauserella rugosa TaxID=43354 RepID=A0A660C7D4_9PSEU|nr:Sec-independent protein translocase subunit TatA [Prauserella rugosa]KID31447.1 twin arginine-targeting protein translocase, TatA/E family [Prauserella sp. Am3]KMS88439.1 hypothetical protein ACZ91_25820 [Streptomyces regensis]TWH19256.1 sec-independent protein translocase protein TatA [Prauserella rugosa]